MSNSKFVAITVLATAALAVQLAGGVAMPRDRLRCFGKPATLEAERYEAVGTPGDDVIVDSMGSGLIEGRGGDDRICIRAGGFHEAYGGPGADRIAGGPGGDNLYGGVGDDLVQGGGGEDLLSDASGGGDDLYSGGEGVDVLRFSLPFSRRVPGVRVDLEAGTASGQGDDHIAMIESVEGTASRDILLGSNADNDLDGIRGGDTIRGRGGDDGIVGATIFTPEGQEGTPPGDPTEGDDPALAGGLGDDSIFGRAGDDRLLGGAGDDLLDGGYRGNDTGEGGPGVDSCRGIERQRGCETAPSATAGTGGGRRSRRQA